MKRPATCSTTRGWRCARPASARSRRHWAASSKPSSCRPRTFRNSWPTARQMSASRAGTSVANRAAISCRISSWGSDAAGLGRRKGRRGHHVGRRYRQRGEAGPGRDGVSARSRWPSSSAERGRPGKIVPVSGAAEIAPHLGIADVVVDITSTGSTLKVNGLAEIETVLHPAPIVTSSTGPATATRS